MVGALWRKMLRDIRRSAATYAICTVIVAVGFCGYAVLSIASERLAASRDEFFRRTSFCDLFAEVHDAPESAARALEEIEGVARAQGRLTERVRVSGIGDGEAQLQLTSITAGGLNLPLAMSGRLPDADKQEILLGNSYLKARGIKAGDTAELVIAGRKTPLTVTGGGISPESIYMLKDVSEMLPDPSGYDAAFLTYDTLAQLLSRPDRANGFVLTLEKGYSFTDVEQAVKKRLEPYGCYRVYERNDQPSVSMLKAELDQLATMTGVIPFLFLIIAAVILYIALSRLIEQQRTQIGTMMALGVPKRAVLAHYLSYGAAVGFAGGLMGGVLGNLAAGPMTDFYRVYFQLPEIEGAFSMRYLAIGIVVATVFCAAVGWGCAVAPSKLAPAEALRPAPPKKARKSFLEWLPGFTKLLTTPGLMAVRGLARGRRRALMSVVGIACAYMITASLASMTSLFDVFMLDFVEKTQQQDITVLFSEPVAAREAMLAVRHPGVEHAEGVVEFPVTLRGRGGAIDCMVQGVAQDSALCRLYDEAGRPVAVGGDGIVLSRHMADLLRVGVGELVEVEVSYPQTKISRVPVGGIVAQYIGSTAYMSHAGAGEISEYRGVYTSMLLKAPAQVRDLLLERLDEAKLVSTVESRQERLEKTRGMMGLILSMTGSMMLLGVLIAFAIIYVSSLIGFEELKREISMMLMLGLSRRQCLDVVSTGQWLIACGGILAGIPLTLWVGHLISASMTTELYSIPPFVQPSALGMAALLVFAAVWMAARAIFQKLKRIYPVDMLRERE